ncbi:MAG: 16S rRNA (cytosine(1402)-N(4))-methyltransferase RsmH [Rhodobacteraceae bacterium]|nr:16S rRNA (cytosine(1402)-N(4))-methyltransferase RsmH [Paracoccaceae bacterium]
MSAGVPNPPHVPALCDQLIARLSPVTGKWVDCTAGAGGYTLALLDAGAEQVWALDCDPEACKLVAERVSHLKKRVTVVNAWFAELDQVLGPAEAGQVAGVVFDLGVSSMQLDVPGRGFSFMRDGPLDMRMNCKGRTAADIVNNEPEATLADILFHFGEEPAARRIARAIVNSRRSAPISTTLQLANLVGSCLPRARSRSARHPATRSFQALRIAVNGELEQLSEGLLAAERVLQPGGKLAVVSFHSLEDRIVKRFLHGDAGASNRHLPPRAGIQRGFVPLTIRPLTPDGRELEVNRRARSAKLRIGIRTDSPPGQPRRNAPGAVRPAGGRG